MPQTRVELSICVYCCRRAELQCGQCHDFYCSKECQLADFDNHRSYCFHIPKLALFDNSEEENIAQSSSDESQKHELQQQSNDNSKQDTVLWTMSELEKVCKESLYDENTLFVDDLKKHKWSNSKNIRVKLQYVQELNVMSFIEDKKIVFCPSEFVQAVFLKLVPQLMENQTGDLPYKNEVILVQKGEIWQRACVLDAKKSGIIVYLVDDGNMILVGCDKVLRLTDKESRVKLSFEICSQDFIVDNVPKILSKKQEEILDSKKMMITNIYVDKSGLFHCEIFGF